jgi:hypothetical protein
VRSNGKHAVWEGERDLGLALVHVSSFGMQTICVRVRVRVRVVCARVSGSGDKSSRVCSLLDHTSLGQPPKLPIDKGVLLCVCV